MNYWYKDRDFPEVKESNADIIAVIERPKELERVIKEHNALVDRVIELTRAVEYSAVKSWSIYRDLDKEANAFQRKQLYELNEFLRDVLNEKKV